MQTHTRQQLCSLPDRSIRSCQKTSLLARTSQCGRNATLGFTCACLPLVAADNRFLVIHIGRGPLYHSGCKVLPVVQQFGRVVSTTIIVPSSGTFVFSFRLKVRAVATDRRVKSLIIIGWFRGWFRGWYAHFGRPQAPLVPWSTS